MPGMTAVARTTSASGASGAATAGPANAIVSPSRISVPWVIGSPRPGMRTSASIRVVIIVRASSTCARLSRPPRDRSATLQSVFSDDERGEEVLRAGGWSRRTAGAIAVAGLVVGLGLAVVLTHGGRGTPGAETSAPAPESSRAVVFYPPTMTGNDAIDVGNWTAEQTRAGARGAPEWFVIASAGLVNYANQAFLIDYPITVTGDGVGQAITVD